MARSLKCLALFVITALTTAAGYVIVREKNHVRDETMIKAFYANRDAFEQKPRDRDGRLEIRIGGWQESLRLYDQGKQTVLCCVSHLSWNFDAYEGYSSSKGYMYSEQEPGRLHDSLDRQFPLGEHYSRIDGNWYIELNNGYSKPE